MAVIFTLEAHLQYLSAIEASKAPADRRPVPTVPELAEAAGISKQAMYKYLNNKTQSVNLATLSEVINALRDRGFPADVPDLLRAYPADKVGAGVPEVDAAEGEE